MNLLRLLVISLLLGAGVVRSQPEAVSMSTLQNLPAVAVTVRGLSPDGAALGVTDSELTRTVVVALQKAGMRVMPPAELARSPNSPTLEVTANITRITARGHLFILMLQLREEAKLVRKTKNLVTTQAITWAADRGGYTTKTEVVYKNLAELADKFVAEWREAGTVPPR